MRLNNYIGPVLTFGAEDSKRSPRQTDHIKQNTKQKFNVITVWLLK